MAYFLQAILARSKTLVPPPDWVADSGVIRLEQGVVMVPLTNTLHDQLLRRSTVGALDPFPGFVYLNRQLAVALQELSTRGTVAYVEVECFGPCEQWAVAWEEGNVVLGPLYRQGIGPVSDVLRLLGVQRRGRADEFEVVGLRKHRSIESWLASAAKQE